MNDTTMVGTARRNRGQLWLLIGIFATPVIAAWVLYFNTDLLPQSRSNKGTLVAPFEAQTLVQLRSAGAAFDPKVLQGNWNILAWGGSGCGERCQARLFDMRQIRLALAELRSHMQRYLVLDGELNTGQTAEYAGTGVLSGTPRTLENVRLELAAHGIDVVPGSVLLIDPMGMVMMQYAVDAPPKDILKDLEKLFKASKNWVMGGGYGHK